MAKDYGARSKRGINKTLIGAALLGVIGVAAMVGFQMRDGRVAHGEDERAASQFKLDGPACETLTPQAFAALRGARKGVESAAEDSRFVMGYGNVECRAFYTKVSEQLDADLACRFTSPAWIVVTTPKATTYYGTGGSPAKVAVKDGQARCALAGPGSP